MSEPIDERKNGVNPNVFRLRDKFVEGTSKSGSVKIDRTVRISFEVADHGCGHLFQVWFSGKRIEKLIQVNFVGRRILSLDFGKIAERVKGFPFSTDLVRKLGFAVSRRFPYFPFESQGFGEGFDRLIQSIRIVDGSDDSKGGRIWTLLNRKLDQIDLVAHRSPFYFLWRGRD